MKRMFSLLLTAALLASLPGCQWIGQLQGQLQLPESQLAASEAVSALLPVAGYTGQAENLEHLAAGEDGTGLLNAYLELAYGLSDGAWEDAAIIRATGASAFELAVLHFADKDKASQTAALLESYLAGRQGDFTGYAPEEAEMVANAGIAQEGSYVALCICPNPDQAVETFRLLIKGSTLAGSGVLDMLPSMSLPPDWKDRLPQSGSSTPVTSETPGTPETSGPPATQYIASYPGRCDFTQPNLDDMSVYNTSAILAAWRTGNPDTLSGYDKDIYNAAQKVLNSVLSTGMSDLEKETAVYNWIVNNVNYDWTHQDVLKKTPRESFTPYGGLVNRTAVCLGYATTFQLLMDLAGVECITVVGASRFSTEDHGWNMVRLNGNWYCADVTWDSNYREEGYTRGQKQEWIFFNITSDMMAKTDHQWDYAHIPEAVTRGNGRR